MSRDPEQLVRFDVWGARGGRSLGPNRSRIASLTACASLLAGTELYVLDAGTGIARLSEALSGWPEFLGVRAVHVLISDMHRDHWEGLKDAEWFWRRMPGLEVRVHAAPPAIDVILQGHSAPPFVPLDRLAAGHVDDFSVVSVAGGTRRRIGSASISTVALQETIGYRLSLGGGPTMAYLCRHELTPENRALEESLLEGAQLALYDASHVRVDDAQAAQRSIEHAADVARSHPDLLVLVGHHAPTAKDAELEAGRAWVGGSLPNLALAVEGQGYRWTGARFEPLPPWAPGASRDTTMVASPGRREAAPPEGSAAHALERRPWIADRGVVAQGGMGRIHHVYDENLKRVVAMKVLPSEMAEDAKCQARFRLEAQVTGQLDHPNIPPVHDFWISPLGEPCFTMKLIQGRTLADELAAWPPAVRSERDLERLLHAFVKVTEAISFAHSRGVLHRDLKPDNIMLGDHGEVYVLDWGLALRLPGAPSPAPGDVVGTASYMAPEQTRGNDAELDQRTDVYLLGGLLYAILTGASPHSGQDWVQAWVAAQTGEVVPFEERAPGVPLPPALCRIAMRALSKLPQDRYPTVDDLREDVQRCLREGWWFGQARFAPGTELVREGDEADAAYIILEGEAEAYRMQGAERVVLRRMGPGDSFGETAIFAGRPRTASVVAVGELTVTVVTREALERAMQGNAWAGAFVRALAQRFSELEEKQRR